MIVGKMIWPKGLARYRVRPSTKGVEIHRVDGVWLESATCVISTSSVFDILGRRVRSYEYVHKMEAT